MSAPGSRRSSRHCRITCVVGARPNFIKLAALMSEMRRRPYFAPLLIHTGQHYSREMSESFFQELELPKADVNLDVGSGTHTHQTAQVMLRLEEALLKTPSDLVLVVGDVNSTLAASLVAVKLRIPLAHVEAGLRSFDRRMPEEVNRVLTDAVSDYLFVSEASGLRNLAAEGIPREKTFLVGNVMIDTLLRFRAKAAQSPVLQELGLRNREYVVVTLHRPSNVDQPSRLKKFVHVLATLAERLPVVFPVHPRTRKQMVASGIEFGDLLLTPPLGYLKFLRLMAEARMVLTDSGGIQEETTILQVPCLTVRENTERPVTVEQGTNRLVGVDPEAVLGAAYATLEKPLPKGKCPDLWDGRAGARILDVIENELNARAV